MHVVGPGKMEVALPCYRQGYPEYARTVGLHRKPLPEHPDSNAGWRRHGASDRACVPPLGSHSRPMKQNWWIDTRRTGKAGCESHRLFPSIDLISRASGYSQTSGWRESFCCSHIGSHQQTKTMKVSDLAGKKLFTNHEIHTLSLHLVDTNQGKGEQQTGQGPWLGPHNRRINRHHVQVQTPRSPPGACRLQ